jgi:hypothetical protein
LPCLRDVKKRVTTADVMRRMTMLRVGDVIVPARHHQSHRCVEPRGGPGPPHTRDRVASRVEMVPSRAMRVMVWMSTAR